MCRVLEVSLSGYYSRLYRKGKGEIRKKRNEDLLNKIRVLFADNKKRYGSLRIHKELKAENIRCGKHKVAKLMREND